MKKAIKIIFFLLLFSLVWKTGVFLFTDERVLDFSGKKVITINDNGFVYSVTTTSANVGGLLSCADILPGEDDLVFPQENAVLFPGMIIEIRRAVPVEISADGEIRNVKTFSLTVERALSEVNIILSHLDKVSPGKKVGIENGMEIEVTRINIEKVTIEESVNFETIEKKDAKVKWRKKKIKQEGVDGAKKVVYEITYKNGERLSKKKLSSEMLREAVPEIVSVGTKVKVGKTKIGVASWYAYTGTMACASRMFPKGTWLRVTNRENGKQVFVVVNDYGPQRGTGKMIDLDKVAFEKLASIGKGVVEVKVEEVL